MSLGRSMEQFVRRLRLRQRRCYRAVFDLSGPAALEVERVLADLRKFCLADASGFDPDPSLHAFRAGKREVWLRLQYFLNLSDQEVHRLRELTSDDDDE